MEMFTSKVMFFMIGMFTIFFSSTFGLDEATMTNPESQEKYADIFESREDTQHQRNVDSQELAYWAPDGFSDLSAAVLNKYSHLPIHLDRQYLEERSVKPAVNLPQRFGRGSEDKIVKSVPNLPQRFGRYLPGKGNIQSAANLPQRFGRTLYDGHASLPFLFGKASEIQRLQYEMNPQKLEMKTSEEGNDRIQGLNYNLQRKLQM
uniref:Neuropeptide VF n=1 Tax=Leptobrachium leishanense TaxID=445787 RepID=A0A8C5MFK0_9ANUR